MKERIPIMILFYCRIEQSFIFSPEQINCIEANAPENLAIGCNGFSTITLDSCILG